MLCIAVGNVVSAGKLLRWWRPLRPYYAGLITESAKEIK